MIILKYKKIFLTIFAGTVLFSVLAITFFGFNLSVDFKGGAIYEIQYTDKIPLISEVKKATKYSRKFSF